MQSRPNAVVSQESRLKLMQRKRCCHLLSENRGEPEYDQISEVTSATSKLSLDDLSDVLSHTLRFHRAKSSQDRHHDRTAEHWNRCGDEYVLRPHTDA